MANKKHQALKKQRAKAKADLLLHTSGRDPEENHNGRDYSPEYTKRVVAWRFFELWMKTTRYKDNPQELWKCFGRLREIFQTLLIHWPDDSLPRGSEFWLVYELLGYYRTGDVEALTTKLYETFGKIN